MTILSSRYLQTVIVLSVMSVAVPANAEERSTASQSETAKTERAARPLRLVFEGIPTGTQVRVMSRAEGPSNPIASCERDCKLELPRGDYTLIASRGEDHRVKDVDLTSSQMVRVGDWDGLARTTGTVMGITGIAVGTLGVAVVVALALQPAPRADDDPAPGAEAVPLVGAAAIAVGTGLAIGGFSLAANNGAPSLNLERLQTEYRPASATQGISLRGKF